MRCKPSLYRAIATSIMVLAIAPPMFARPQSSKNPQTWKISQLQQTASLIHVAPRANPNGDGSQNNPYPSITAALATNPMAGTVIQLAQGVYSAESGESFPLKIPAGVTLRGDQKVKGANTVIRGGGKFISPTFASQNITMFAENGARLEGLTVTNPNTRGTAVWVESGKSVAITNNTFINSNREGLFLTGTADAIVIENVFKQNGANGLSAVGNSTGEIRDNVFENTGFGLSIGQKSRVNVSNNTIVNNTDGIVISNLSAPTLRNNLISASKRNGIVILKDSKGYPTPDLGTSTNPGKNIFRNNIGEDLNNNSGVTQVAVGNQLNPKKVAGNIAYTGDSPTPPASRTTPSPMPVSRATLPPVPKATLPPVPKTDANASNEDTIEITRSPQPSISRSTMPPTVLAPPKNNSFLEPLPDVPQPVTTSKQNPSPIPRTIPPVTTPKPSTPSTNLSQNPNEVLIDRAPTPVVPPKPVTPPRTIVVPGNPPPKKSPTTTKSSSAPINSTQPTITPPPAKLIPPIPFNYRVAALVPPPLRETKPYLVVIPSSDAEVLNRARSVVPAAKVITSRFGNMIIVLGYPDRERAEILKMIMRSIIGLDARVVYQNNL
ncbi:MAG: hypothetical protein DCF20_05885 [Pseudanabaena sp.]|nr:MAG: hypothetical protein DCF20_05885 [Pseudanabaena sp.]